MRDFIIKSRESLMLDGRTGGRTDGRERYREKGNKGTEWKSFIRVRRRIINHQQHSFLWSSSSFVLVADLHSRIVNLVDVFCMAKKTQWWWWGWGGSHAMATWRWAHGVIELDLSWLRWDIATAIASRDLTSYPSYCQSRLYVRIRILQHCLFLSFLAIIYIWQQVWDEWKDIIV